MVTPRSDERREAKKNGHAVAGEALPDGWNQWPGLGEAVRRLGTSSTFIYSMVNKGELRTIIAPDGHTKYNPEDLKACALLLEADKEHEKTPRGNLSADEFKAGNELVRFVMQSFEKMVPILVSGFESAAARGVEQSERDNGTIVTLMSRIAALEDSRDKVAADREKQLSEEHLRKLAQSSFEAGERRKDKAFSVITDKLAPIFIQKLGLDSDPKIKTGLALLASIKREQLMGLLAFSDTLEEVQKKQILELLGELSIDEREALEGAGILPKSPPQGGETQKE